ncbi:MAG TPA: ribonuclease Z [Longimicrobiales bacterium]|nr:ribonuclease Z [Longimicrobiales bacterium]
MIRITFLGTAASRPTVGRNVSSLVVQRMGESLMFDCGEGTQRQMMRFGTGFALSDIFFTHMHADHFLGVIGLLRTMGLQGRDAAMRLWTPRGTEAILESAVHLGVERVPFDVSIHALRGGQKVKRDDYDVVAFRTAHGGPSLGFALVEHERLGRFHPDRARELGVPEGPLFGRLHRGEAVEVGGRTITPEDVVGPARPGRRVVYTGDTRPSEETVKLARDADLLIHDATFAEEEAERARETGHSTAREAADVAREAGVRRLVMTHVSPRYADDPYVLEREARRVFRSAVVAFDGMEVDVPYRDDDE